MALDDLYPFISNGGDFQLPAADVVALAEERLSAAGIVVDDAVRPWLELAITAYTPAGRCNGLFGVLMALGDQQRRRRRAAVVTE